MYQRDKQVFLLIEELNKFETSILFEMPTDERENVKRVVNSLRSMLYKQLSILAHEVLNEGGTK